MDFAEGILTDLAEADAFDQWRRVQSMPGERAQLPCPAEPGDVRRLALLRAEILNVGMGASVIASLANAAESMVFQELSVANVFALVPGQSTTFESDIFELSGKAHFFEIAQHVQGFLARLSLARSLSKAFAERSGGSARESFCPLAVIADSWRRVCRAAIAAHSAIAESMHTSGHIGTAAVEHSTLELLRSASLGGWPCISREGYLSIPGWAERRVERRISVGLPVGISLGAARFPGIIENATPTGLGLSCSLTVEAGAEIGVQISDGRSLVGIVQWGKSGKLGVRLTEPLSPDDLLLTGGLE
jgi:hypothetical protein